MKASGPHQRWSRQIAWLAVVVAVVLLLQPHVDATQLVLDQESLAPDDTAQLVLDQESQVPFDTQLVLDQESLAPDDTAQIVLDRESQVPVDSQPALDQESQVPVDSSAIVGRGWQMHRLDASKYPLAKCLDGTQGVYYVRGPKTKKVVIHLQGGGWCTPGGIGPCRQGKRCVGRSSGELGSTKRDGGAYMKNRYRQGWYSTDRNINPFFDWTMVYIRYCDGASFSGRRQSPLPGQKKLFSRGNFILEAVIDELKKPGGILSSPSHVVVRGSSAGGLSALLHAHQFKSALPEWTKMAGISDAGFFPALFRKLDKCSNSFVSYFKQIYAYSEALGSLPESCTMTKSDNLKYQCMFAEHIIPHIKVPVLVINSRYDTWHVGSMLGCGPGKRCSPGMIRVYGRSLGGRISRAVTKQNSNFHGPSSGIFLNSCSNHISAAKDTVFTGTKASGTSARAALSSFVARVFFGKTKGRKRWISTAPYPCKSCCGAAAKKKGKKRARAAAKKKGKKRARTLHTVAK